MIPLLSVKKYHEMFKVLQWNAILWDIPNIKKNELSYACMHMCVMSIIFAFFYDFVLDFGIVPTGWYFRFNYAVQTAYPLSFFIVFHSCFLSSRQ